MTWVKIDDGFFRHPKIRAAGRDARDLYLAALCYCNENLTDGFVPDYEVRRLSAEADIDDPKSALASLCHPRGFGSSLWTSVPGGYHVHDYHDYQPSRADVLRLKEIRAEAGSRGGRRSVQAKDQENKEPEASAAPQPVGMQQEEAVSDQEKKQVANQNAEQLLNHFADQFASQNDNPVSRIPYPVSRVPESERERDAAAPPRSPGDALGSMVPTEAEAAAYCTSKGFPQCGEAFWTYWQARGWVDAQGRPIRDWHMAARNWITKERPPDRAARSRLGAAESAGILERQLVAMIRPDGIRPDGIRPEGQLQ